MIEGFLLDVDGTVLDRGVPVPGAAEVLGMLRQRGIPFLFATNTSRKSRRDVAESLTRAGIPASTDEVLSAGFATATFLEREGVRRLLPLLSAAALQDFASFEVTGDDPEVVVVGDMGSQITFDLLNAAFLALRTGARLVACQRNRFWKSERGETLDAGAFVVALEYAAKVTAKVIGKPSAEFFLAGARELQVPAARIAVVGDGLDTDVAGARAAGMTSVLVRTGLFDATTLEATSPRDRPDRVLDSIRDLETLFEARS